MREKNDGDRDEDSRFSRDRSIYVYNWLHSPYRLPHIQRSTKAVKEGVKKNNENSTRLVLCWYQFTDW